MTYSKLFLQAYKSQKLGDNKVAVQYYQKCMSLNLNDPAIFINLHLMLKSKDRILSIASLSIAYQLSPNQPLCIKSIKSLSKEFKGQENGDRNDPGKLLREILGIFFAENNISKPNLIRKAMDYFNTGNFIYSYVVYKFIAIIDTEINSHLQENIALCCYKMSNWPEADKIYSKLYKDKKYNKLTLNNYAILLLEINALERAKDIVEEALKKFPDYADAWNTKGNILARMNKSLNAIRCYNKALDIEPGNIEFSTNLANQLITTGEFKKSLKLLQSSLENENISVNILKSYTELTKRPLEKKYKEWLLEKLLTEECEETKATIEFTLARSAEREKDYEAAFFHYSNGNRIRKQILKFDLESYLSKIDSTLQVQNVSNSKQVREPYDPIFVLGLPRTGTSLVEQMLAMCEDISALGELNFICDFFEAYDVNMIKDFTSTSELRSSYYDYVRRVHEPKIKFTDKMPLNYQYANILLNTFSTSKLLMLRRDKLPTIWSIYSTNFATKGNKFAYSISEISRVYDHYVRFCKKITQIYPNRVMIVDYSSLINAPETYTKSIADFVGVSWTKNWLEFSENKRAVNTASGITLRDGLLTRRDHRWTPYEVFIKEQLA